MTDIGDLIVHLAMSLGIVGDAVAMIFMLKIWRSYDESLAIFQRQLYDLYIRQLGREHGTGFPSMAEDTEVAE